MYTINKYSLLKFMEGFQMKKYMIIFAFIFASFLLLGCTEGPVDEDPTEVIPQFTITFNSNGGSNVVNITADENSIINKPTDPTKDSNTFQGWFINSSLTSPVSWPYTLTGNITFYAKWEVITQQNTYTISWEVDGTIVETDTNVLEGTLPVYNGVAPTKPSTQQYEYTFTGWLPSLVNVESDQTYVAQFSETIRQYVISFNSNGGSSVAAITSAFHSQINEPIKPTREGYNFVSWCLDSNLTQVVEWPITVSQSQTLYAKWNESVPYGAYLQSLLSNYSSSPLSFIPDSMLPGETLITSQQATIDYSSFVNMTSIPFGGFGEQWNMVITNLEQSQSFFTVLSVVDTLASASVTAFNNYLDSNPADTANYSFLSGIYSVTIKFENNQIFYVLDYTATLPIFGLQTVQIALSQNILTNEKEGRIQIGQANALRYIVSEDSYQFAIRYLGIRRAYFEISRDNQDHIEGRLFEYLGLDDVFTMGSAAEFYINDDYVSVVGNKSSSMLGWTGTITELYNVNTGKLLGYEIKETLSAITYNTLWFNLGDTSGITTIKVETAPFENSNPYLVYINGSSEVFASRTVGGLSLKSLSRRYDIELRKQYFYYLSGEELVKVELLVPMIFVQQEQLSTLVSDVNSRNIGLTFALNVSSTIQNQIISDYTTLIDPFIARKDEYTIESILAFIGSSIEQE